MKQCKCGSYAFNLYKEDIDQGDLCDVHYWKEKALAQLDPYKQGYADAMNWKIQNHLEHLPAAQPEQEPVAWQVEVLIQGVWSPVGNPQREKSRAEKLAANPSIPKECQRVIELYTTPPQRIWVELTDEEISWIAINNPPLVHEFARAVEAKLKEKNT